MLRVKIHVIHVSNYGSTHLKDGGVTYRVILHFL